MAARSNPASSPEEMGAEVSGFVPARAVANAALAPVRPAAADALASAASSTAAFVSSIAAARPAFVFARSSRARLTAASSCSRSDGFGPAAALSAFTVAWRSASFAASTRRCASVTASRSALLGGRGS